MHNTAANRSLIFFVFSFFLIINLISSGGHTDAWDGMVTFLLVESMATKHTAKLHPDILTIANSNPKDPAYTMAQWEVYYNKIVAGKNAVWGALEPVYSTRSLLLPSISVPFYYAALAISLPPILVIPLFVNSFIITLTSLVVFCFSLEIYSSKKIAYLLGLIFTVCSSILPYNTSLFPQPTSIIVIPGFVVYSIFSMRHNKKSLISFLLTLSLPSHWLALHHIR